MTSAQVGRFIVVVALAVTFVLLSFHVLGQASADVAFHQASGDPIILQGTQTFTVSGQVISGTSGPGIGSVKVFVWNRNLGSGAVEATTDPNGAFSLTLQSNDYDLIFNPPCGSPFASRSYKGVSGPPDVALNVSLTRGYALSGTVYAPDMLSHVPKTALYAHNKDTAEGFGLPGADGSGRYCIGLVAGSYDLGFTPPSCTGLGPRTVTITLPPGGVFDVFLPEGFTVAGCVSDSVSNPVAGVQVYAFDPSVGGFGFAPTNETGCFTGTLPIGTFDLQFIPTCGHGLGSVTVVDVGRNSDRCPNTALPLTLPAGFDVSGRAVCHAWPVKNLFVYADPAGPPAPGDDLDGWGLYTVDDGSYCLPLVPDVYRFEFIPPAVTGFSAVNMANVQVVSDTILNVEFCPMLLPLVLKDYSSP